MGWYKSFSRKFRMALASSGKSQVACECDLYEPWTQQEYVAGSIVLHENPTSGDLSIYKARGDYLKGHSLDKINDEPGLSIHWEFICSCREIGFTPTPTPTPSPEPDATPTPTDTFAYPTPTPTMGEICDEYEEWNPNKVVSLGHPHYKYKERVQYNGKIYEVRDYEGTEVNDIPGESNHWIFLFDCIESTPTPTPLPECCDEYSNVLATTGTLEPTANLSGIKAFGFEQGGELCFSDLNITNLPGRYNFKTEDESIVGFVTTTGEFSNRHIRYVSSDGDCYEVIAESQSGFNILKKR